MADSNSVVGMAQPIQSSVQNWVDGQEQKGFAYREEQRKVAELDRLAKEREAAKQRALEDQFLKRPKTDATGLKSIDDAINAWSEDNMSQRYEIYKRSSKFNNLSASDRRLLASLDAMPETVALMTKAYKEDSQRYFEGVKKGTIKRDPDYELKLQRLPTSARAFLDEDGNPAIGIDNDGDGKPDIISFDMNGLSLKPRYVQNIDLEDALKSTVDNLETEILKTDSNFRTRTTEGLPLKIAQDTAARMVTNPDGSLTPLAISYFHDQGFREAEELDESKIKDFTNYLTDRLVNSKKRRNETDVDYGAMTAAERERRLARGEEKDKPLAGTPVQPTYQTWGIQFNDIDANRNRSVPVTGKVILPAVNVDTGKRVNGKPEVKNLTNATVENFTYNKNGEMVIDVSQSTGKTSTISGNSDDEKRTTSEQKEKYQTRVSKETEARIAKMLGTTPQGLRDMATNPDGGGAYDNLGQ